jgi:hypothetical protein
VQGRERLLPRLLLPLISPDECDRPTTDRAENAGHAGCLVDQIGHGVGGVPWFAAAPTGTGWHPLHRAWELQVGFRQPLHGTGDSRG